jgi:hypothetical protein
MGVTANAQSCFAYNRDEGAIIKLERIIPGTRMIRISLYEVVINSFSVNKFNFTSFSHSSFQLLVNNSRSTKDFQETARCSVPFPHFLFRLLSFFLSLSSQIIKIVFLTFCGDRKGNSWQWPSAALWRLILSRIKPLMYSPGTLEGLSRANQRTRPHRNEHAFSTQSMSRFFTC